MKKLKINIIFATILILTSQVFNVFGVNYIDDYDEFDSDFIISQIIASENAEEETSKPVLLPDIKLESPTIIDIAGAGKKDYSFNFKNSSSDAAKNLYFELSFDTSAPFIAYFSDKSNLRSHLGGRSQHTTNITIETFSNAKNGTYPLTFEYVYYDTSNEKVKYTGTSTVYINISNMSAEAPIVTLEDFSISTANIKAGNDFTVNAKLHNINNNKISNVQVVIDGLSSDKIFYSNGNNNFYTNSLNGKSSVPVSFNLKSSKDLKTSTNEVIFKVIYNDADGATHEFSYPYFINIEGVSTNNSLAISVQSPSKVMAPEEIFTVVATVTNNGSSNLKDITLIATPQIEQSISPMSANTINISSLEVGKSSKHEFKFMATKDASTQTHIINVSATYEANDKEVKSTNYASASVSNPDKDDKDEEDSTSKSVPKIILSSYTTSPEIVYAGEPFELTMDFLNTSQNSEVKNIKVYLSVPSDSTETGNIFSPVNGSNTFYMYSIPAGSVVTKTLHLQPDYNASAKNYDLNVTMEYEDADNNSLNQTEIVGIKVNQVIKLEYGTVEVQEYADVYAPINVSFQFYNTGKVDLSNLKMKVVGDAIEENDSESFFGKFSIGSSDYYDGSFSYTETGEQSGYVYITYEDENGRTIEDKVEFSSFVNEPMSFEDFDEGNFQDEFAYEEPNSTNPFLIVGGILALIVSIVVIVIIIRRKKSKREDDDLIE